jgi:hypothetical protein
LGKALKRTCLTLVVLCSLGLVTTARAADDAPCGQPGGPDWIPHRGLTFFPSLGLSGTTGLYGAAAVIAGHKPARCSVCGNERFSSGAVLEAAIGTHAGRAALGYASVNPLLFGFAIKLVAERQWRATDSVQSGTLFIGPEATLRIGRVIVTTGVLGRAAGHGAKHVRWTWAVGFGA